MLAGVIGLGGAEFRLPVLLGVFGFAALHAVILNKAMSLVVVITALPARLLALPYTEIATHWSIAVNLLTGSLAGAWLGASWATRMHSRTLYRVLATLLVLIALTLVVSHLGDHGSLDLPPPARASPAANCSFRRSCCCSPSTSSLSEACRSWCHCPPCSSRSPATAATRASTSFATTIA